MSQKDGKRKAQLGNNDVTIVDWSNFCQDVGEWYLINNPSEIGGISANGEPLVVEVDESKFFHRKYHRGQWVPGHWVFGGVERAGGAGLTLHPIPT